MTKEVAKEVRSVVLAHTVLQEGAVMIKGLHTHATAVAVFCTHLLVYLADLAEVHAILQDQLAQGLDVGRLGLGVLKLQVSWLS